VTAFLAYAFYSRDHGDLNEEEQATLTRMVGREGGREEGRKGGEGDRGWNA